MLHLFSLPIYARHVPPRAKEIYARTLAGTGIPLPLAKWTRTMEPALTVKRLSEHGWKQNEYNLSQNGDTKEQCVNDSSIDSETIAIASLNCAVNAQTRTS